MARKRTKKAPASPGGGGLYFMVFLLLSGGYLMTRAATWPPEPSARPVDWFVLGAPAVAVLLFRLVFGRAAFKGDRVIPLLTLLLSGIGLLIQFRLGNLALTGAARASTFAYPLGLLLFLVTWLLFRNGRHAFLERLGGACLLLAAAVLAGILVLGERMRGAVFLAGQYNPSEVVKLLLAVFLAGMLTQFRKPLQQTVAGLPAPPMRSLLALSCMWALPMVLLVMQRDLGMIILLNLVLIVMLFMATGRWGYWWIGAAGCVAAGYAGFRFFAHARARFLAWQDPFEDATGRGWQILQSLSAMFSGGLWGSGLGGGTPGMVPIAESDFVYAVWAEEMGFVGCVLLALTYLALFYRGYRVADQLRAPFAQTLAAALTTLLAVQTLMNIGGVTKAIPVTGITLPLISQGGSSFVTCMLLLGLLTALSEPAPARRSGKA